MTQKKDMNQWFDEEFGFAGTTKEQREAVSLYGYDAVFGEDADKWVEGSGRCGSTATNQTSAQEEKATAAVSNCDPREVYRLAKCTIGSEYVALADRVKQLNHAYYIENNSPVSDDEFDAMMLQLEMVEELHPEWRLNDSPTQTVGSDAMPGVARQIRHRTQMMSTKKAHDMGAVGRWWKQQYGDDLVIEWKYDGISCSLVYQDGKLIEASTRGKDGWCGNDILRHVQGMENVPQELRIDNGELIIKGRIEVRGEILCPFQAYEKMYPWDRKKTIRDTASAWMQQQASPQMAAQLGLRFIPWEVIVSDGCDSIAADATTHTGRMDWLQAAGFEVEPRWTAHSLEEVEKIIAQATEQRESLPYPTDGLVIKQNQDTDRNAQGETAKYPNWSLAWKFAPATVETTLRTIETKTAASGRQTIILHFDEVELGGKTCTKVRACEAQNFGTGKYDLHIGDRIRIKLSGDVNPQFDGKCSKGCDSIATDGTDVEGGWDYACGSCSSRSTASQSVRPVRWWQNAAFRVCAQAVGAMAMFGVLYYTGLLIPVALVGLGMMGVVK